MKDFVTPDKMFSDWDYLTREERNYLEEIQYRKQLIISHGFTHNEYSIISKSKNKGVD